MKIAISLLLSLAIHAQTREVMDYGTYVIDASGRYVRLEGRDGVVEEYLYDKPGTETAGVIVHVNDKLTLTVMYPNRDEIKAPGLPTLTHVSDFEGRTTTVLADGKAIAQLEYTQDGYFTAITLPGRFAWKTSKPNASRRVRQTVEDTSGQVVRNAVVSTHFTIDGIRHDASYEAAGKELGVDLDAVTYEDSPTGLTTARDAQGRVAFYVVGAPGFDVGFSPAGKPLFYDIPLSVEGGEIAPGGDLVISETWEGQRGTYPDHLVLTARGSVGLYAHESANGAIDAVWMNPGGRVHTRTSEVEQVASQERR